MTSRLGGAALLVALVVAGCGGGDDEPAATSAATTTQAATETATTEGPTASSGLSEGTRWIYVVSPWGLQLELVSYPNGRAMDRMAADAAGSAEGAAGARA